MDYKYDVTLSFAGEDRQYVDELANVLKENGVKVFYDRFEEVDLWGKDLSVHFDYVYRKSARYCIPFISEHYKKKIWTNYEIKNALARAVETNGDYILPVRFDDTEIEGIRSTIAYFDLRNYTPAQFASLVLKKLNKMGDAPNGESLLGINGKLYQTKQEDHKASLLIKAIYLDVNKFVEVYVEFWKDIYEKSVPIRNTDRIEVFFSHEYFRLIWNYLNLSCPVNDPAERMLVPEYLRDAISNDDWWKHIADKMKRCAEQGSMILRTHTQYLEPQVYQMLHHITTSNLTTQLTGLHMGKTGYANREKSPSYFDKRPLLKGFSGCTPVEEDYQAIITLYNWCAEFYRKYSGVIPALKENYTFKPYTWNKFEENKMPRCMYK